MYVGTSKEGSAVMEEAQKLITDGLESRLHSVLEDLLSSSPPENMVSSCIRWFKIITFALHDIRLCALEISTGYLAFGGVFLFGSRNTCSSWGEEVRGGDGAKEIRTRY